MQTINLHFSRYIEASKARLSQSGSISEASVAQAVLLYVFENILKLLHPFMPFVTEELWQVIGLTIYERMYQIELLYLQGRCLFLVVGLHLLSYEELLSLCSYIYDTCEDFCQRR